MPAIRSVLALLLALQFSGGAHAVLAESKIQENQADMTKHRKEVPRRAVPALIERPPAPVPVPRVTAPLPSVPQSAVPSGPAPVTGCDPGGCWSGGNRYDGGAGGTYLDKGGRLCQSNGTWIQCF